MVWIYGGGWEDGTSTWYDGRGIVAQGIVIVSDDVMVSCAHEVDMHDNLGPSSDIRLPELCECTVPLATSNLIHLPFRG